MSNNKVLVLGVATLWPPIYIIAVFVWVLGLSGASASGGTLQMSPGGAMALFAAHATTLLIMVALLPIYLGLAATNKGLEDTSKILWILAIVLVSFPAMLAYWWIHVRGSEPHAEARRVGRGPGSSVRLHQQGREQAAEQARELPSWSARRPA